jgi:hypothetical protein
MLANWLGEQLSGIVDSVGNAVAKNTTTDHERGQIEVELGEIQVKLEKLRTDAQSKVLELETKVLEAQQKLLGQARDRRIRRGALN